MSCLVKRSEQCKMHIILSSYYKVRSIFKKRSRIEFKQQSEESQTSPRKLLLEFGICFLAKMRSLE